MGIAEVLTFYLFLSDLRYSCSPFSYVLRSLPPDAFHVRTVGFSHATNVYSLLWSCHRNHHTQWLDGLVMGLWWPSVGGLLGLMGSRIPSEG